MLMNLAEIGRAMQAVGNYEQYEDLWVDRIQTDSRLIKPGDLFICLPGEHFDGHQFAGEALQNGAIGVVAEKPLEDLPVDSSVLLVKNSLRALGQLAWQWRKKFQGQVIAISGSAGKTSLKEFMASILQEEFKVGKNFKNWNNQLGVPLSILGFSGQEDFWVLEAGINQKGEMENLAGILNPDITVIHNIGPVHLEGLGDEAGVIEEKSRLLAYTRQEGLGIICQDYPLLKQKTKNLNDLRWVFFSTQDSDCPYYGKYVGLGQNNRSIFRLFLSNKTIEVSLDFGGSFLLENIIAASTTAFQLGCNPKSIASGLKQAELPEHRCQIYRIGQVTLIDDCYNANPMSMSKAIRSAKDMAGDDPLILVLGDMKELGFQAEGQHRKLGQICAQIKPSSICYLGQYYQDFLEGYYQEDPHGWIKKIEANQEVISWWKSLDLQRATILIKGSRGCRLEIVVQELIMELKG